MFPDCSRHRRCRAFVHRNFHSLTTRFFPPDEFSDLIPLPSFFLSFEFRYENVLLPSELMDIYIRVYFVEVKSYRVIETIFVGDFYEFKLAPRESVHDGEK